LLVIGHEHDREAEALAEDLGGGFLSPADLAQPGWRVPFPGSSSGTFVAGGTRREVSDIGCVLTRLSRVTQRDIPSIARCDQRFAAREMTAFLFAWLSELECLVVNRPTSFSLSGEVGSRGWTGIPGLGEAGERRSPARSMIVSLVDGQVVDVRGRAEKLEAIAAGSGVLALVARWSASLPVSLVRCEIQFGPDRGWEFLGADGLPGLRSARAREAVSRLVSSRLGRGARIW
jgi:hypothetical protein